MSDGTKSPTQPSGASAKSPAKAGDSPADKTEAERAEAVLRVEQDNRVRNVRAEAGGASPEEEGLNPDG